MTRRAITTLETLVCIGILAVLLGLLFPAVQRVREAASRAACASNLRQLALACHHHGDLTGRWPSAGTGWNDTADGWLTQTAAQWENAERVVWCPVRGSVRHWDSSASTDYAAAIPSGHQGQPVTNEYTPPSRWIIPALITPADRPRYPVRLSCPTARGLSETLLIAHTWQHAGNWGTGENYRGSWRAGYGLATVRSTLRPPRRDTDLADGYDYGFGGPHAVVLCAYGDGSVRGVGFEVDADQWREGARQ